MIIVGCGMKPENPFINMSEIHIKVNRNQRRDFEFLLNSELDGLSDLESLKTKPADPNGYSAIECWVAQDTYGKKDLPCSEPDTLQVVVEKKKAWNLQIRMWSESVVEGTFLVMELDDMHLPKWIKKAVINQSKKLLSEKYGIDCSSMKFDPKYELHGLDAHTLIKWNSKLLGNVRHQYS